MSKYSSEVEERLRREAQQIMDRYPKGHQQSALIPMLHLVQSEDGFVSADGIAFCAQMLELSRSEVSAVATFYTQFKRHPAGKYNVGICTNALCAVLGGMPFTRRSRRSWESALTRLLKMERSRWKQSSVMLLAIMLRWSWSIGSSSTTRHRSPHWTWLKTSRQIDRFIPLAARRCARLSKRTNTCWRGSWMATSTKVLRLGNLPRWAFALPGRRAGRRRTISRQLPLLRRSEPRLKKKGKRTSERHNH